MVGCESYFEYRFVERENQLSLYMIDIVPGSEHGKFVNLILEVDLLRERSNQGLIR